MPTWVEEDFVQIPAGKFKFITGRHAQHTQSSSQNNIILLDVMRESYAWINKDEADKRGIR